MLKVKFPFKLSKVTFYLDKNFFFWDKLLVLTRRGKQEAKKNIFLLEALFTLYFRYCGALSSYLIP